MADGFDAFADSEELPPSLPALDVERGALACVLCDEGEVHRAFVRMAPLLAPETFGNPLHGVIWRAFALVHARGDGLDPVMVGEALLAARQPKAKALLTELVRTSVAPARCEAYARRLAEHALRRATRAQLVEALARVDGEGAPLDVVSDVRGILAAIPADVQGAYDDSLHAAVVETLAEIEASMAACQNHQNTCARWGVPTLDGGWYNGGWNDGALGGLFRSKLYVLGGVPASGKAQPLDAKVLTPGGFVRMGDLSVGDFVIGRNGKPCRVTGVYPQGVKPVYRVVHSDGAATECCAEHLWFTRTKAERRKGSAGSAKTLTEIRETLKIEHGTRANHHVPIADAAHFDVEGLRPLSPYLLGLLLGDGNFASGNIAFSNSETDIRARFVSLLPPEDATSEADELTLRVRRAQRSGERSETAKAIDGLGLYGTDCYRKFIPIAYLLAPVEDRLELLRGLLDTDGYVDDSGQSVEFSTSSEQMAAEVSFLARSLGAILTVNPHIPTFTVNGETRTSAVPAHRMYMRFPNGITPVSSAKHLARWRANPASMQGRYIDRIEPVGEKECQCIMVDSSDHLYVTDDFLVTHNTTLAWQAALATATDEHLTDRRVLVFSLEMSRTDLVKRLAGQKAGVPEMVIERGALNGDQWEKLKTAMQELARLPIAIIGRCRTVESIRARVLAECAAGGVGLVVVDFLQLAKTAQRTRDKNEADEERIYALKHLANEARVPMLAITAMTKMAQAKVAKESDAASSTDAKGAGSEYAADVLAFLVRTNPRDTRAEVDVQFAMTKRRGGQEGDVLLEFDRSRGRFRPHPSASGSQFTDEGIHDDL